MMTQDEFDKLASLIEDGELDDYMIHLRNAMDERNARRKNEIMKIVKSVWGDGAEIVAGSQNVPLAQAQPVTTNPSPVYMKPASPVQSSARLPMPIEAGNTTPGVVEEQEPAPENNGATIGPAEDDAPLGGTVYSEPDLPE